MKKLIRALLNFLLPPRCIVCGKVLSEENGICPECFNQITFISAPYCKKCGLPFPNLNDVDSHMLCPACLNNDRSKLSLVRSVLKYDNTSKRPILAFKFMDRTENAKVFASWLKIAGKDIFNNKPDLIIPVPLHYFRLVKRRYNQSALLAMELSRLTNVEADTNCLLRIKNTIPQTRFCGRERINNVKKSFKVKYPEKIKGRRIVLIDDVMTTGSTLNECADALLAAGASKVDALTIARVYR